LCIESILFLKSSIDIKRIGKNITIHISFDNWDKNYLFMLLLNKYTSKKKKKRGVE
jgi:hypothetical protein